MITDQLILNAKVYNSYYKRFAAANVAVKEGHFLYVGPLGAETFAAAETIDAKGQYLVPGLIDIHLHIESTMITPETFSYGILQHGVTTIVPEPHEMANVFGVEGVHEMIRASKDCLVDMIYAIPSSVPATPLETTGGSIEISDIDELMETHRIACLGEVMNYVDVIRDPDCKSNHILRHVRSRYPGLVIEGHTPKLLDLDLHSLIYAGIDSDHTHQSIEGLTARIAAGMFIEIQEKSMTPEVVDYLISHPVSEHFCFVTDDVMTDSLVQTGHLDHLVRKAIAMGMAPEDAVYAATYTPARRMKLDDRGVVAPNKTADYLLLSDLSSFAIEAVYKRGLQVYDRKQPQAQAVREPQFPAHFYQSVQLEPLAAGDFAVPASLADGRYGARVMMVNNVSTFTEEKHVEAVVKDGLLEWQETGCGLIATFERYGKNGNRAYGLIGGDTIKRGAVATTYSHDNHNLLVVGHNAADMVLAANTVIAGQGGFCVVCDGKVLALLALPVGGILTEAPLAETAEQVLALRTAMESLGYNHYNPIMSISTHSLPVSPALKITDHGLIDVGAGKVVPLLFPLGEE
ncbi:adenine deaminase C-terminal domain-containing protein [Paenibacillus sp. MMS20-IR301]|uniref:adenine deaminase C-terminal domain-containing protein n=1 Tax=Paenibacillus sp. MMS20-IR301 TaxID=2895946 RepID=UPI0028E70113|nr:adenine deaminase C-terminal domain-containing protein [Paenibacillus sp. MMS20-IR301]WNS41402.1 adenine deaminase C-terminal domain-containing protein [Paenibacillus sp. MMS20-IR301]